MKKDVKKQLVADLRKYSAEFFGTFVLTLAVAFSLTGTFPVPTPVIAGLALGYGVYALGHVSGAHFNPAITLGMAWINKITPRDVALYLAAQFLGAAAAARVARHALHTPLPIAKMSVVFPAEAIGAFIFAFGVAAVAHGKVSQGASGLAVGGSLLLGISLAAAAGSNGVLNPAVALGIGSFSWGYILGPIVGAMLAVETYKYLGGK